MLVSRGAARLLAWPRCREMVKTVDLRNPHQWFPVARSLSRRIIYHAGPTNSGV